VSAVIAGYARTPFVKFTGAFASIPATALGAHAITAALARAGVAPEDVQYVVAGQVLQGGAGQNPARQSAVGAGIPLTVPAMTLNAVCLSGTEAVAWAARLIDSGDVDIAVAVGQESMSLAPHVWSARAGQRYGSIELLDTVAHDGLRDAFEQRSMGESTEHGNGELALGRDAQDAFAAASHARAAASADYLAEEIALYTITGRRGDTVVSADDGVRADTTVEGLAGLRPAFSKDGTITAGNSSQITDGAAALVLMSPAAAAARGITGLATVEAHALVAGPDVRLHAQPANAILAALAKTDDTVADLAVVEINEAFASVAVHSTELLGVDAAIVNRNGGAIALGHPIGASGARIVGHLARQLHDLGPGTLGAVGICGGGGQGSAIVLRGL
jgi:acetyl-CoA C-acetyltransferase